MQYERRIMKLSRRHELWPQVGFKYPCDPLSLCNSPDVDTLFVTSLKCNYIFNIIFILNFFKFY